MNHIKTIYPTKPEFATDTRGNKYPLLYTIEEDIWVFFEKEVLEIFKKYNIKINYKDDDTFADWLSISHQEGLFDEWDVWELRSLFCLQWMVDLKAGSPNITNAIVRQKVYNYSNSK